MSKARPNPWPVLVALLLAMGGVRAESAPRIETFELSQRPGEELMEIVRPLLAPDEAVQADGFRLIVRARPATLEEIEALLARLDHAPRQLLIRVRQPRAGIHSRAAAQARIEVGGGDGGSARARLYGTESREEAGAVQGLRVLEGRAAFIETGQAVPSAERSIAIGPRGAIVHDGIRYREVASGFYVVARVAGEEVILELATRRETLSHGGGGRVETSAMVTTVRGRLGDWLTVATSDARLAAEGAGIIYRSGERGKETASVELRVDIAD